MNEPLPFKELHLQLKYQQRVLFLNPAEIYARINIQPYKRRQTPQNIGMQFMFPKQAEKICSCGCGQKLEGKRSRWATDECASFAVDVYHIIYGHLDTIKFYLKEYHGRKCKCGKVRKMKVDHIIPVKHGGGGCWLSNYQFLCHACHVEKTNTDFGWKQQNIKAILRESKETEIKDVATNMGV